MTYSLYADAGLVGLLDTIHEKHDRNEVNIDLPRQLLILRFRIDYVYG